MYIRQVSPRAYFLSRQDDIIASFLVWRMECTDVFFQSVQHEVFLRHLQTFILLSIIRTFIASGVVMASPGQKEGSCGHIMALFDAHSKSARCCEKGIGQDPCIEKICDNFSEDQKKQLATPTYRVRKEHPKKASSPSLSVDPTDITVLGKVESKGDSSCDRRETPSKKAKKSSHKSPTEKKAGKATVDFQADLKSMDDKWSERFARLEAMFLAKSFQVPVEPVKNSDVVVTDRPFIPPTQQPTGVTGEKQPSGAASKRYVKKATQPVEVPGAVLATRPVEAPGAATVTHHQSGS